MAHLDGLGRLVSAANSSGHEAKLVVLTAAKGGVGTSSIAVNLAVLIRRLSHRSVILVDGDLSAGDHDVLLGLPGTAARRGLYEAVVRGATIDAETLEQSLVTGPGGVRHLLSPVDPRLSESVGNTQWRDILRVALSLADLVVVDCREPYSDRGLSSLELADQILAVSTPEMSALRNTLNLLNTVTELGWDHKAHVIINRADTAFRRSVLESVLGKPALAAIPSIGAVMVRALNAGTPLLLTSPHHASAKHWEEAALGILGTLGWELPGGRVLEEADAQDLEAEGKPVGQSAPEWVRSLTRVSAAWDASIDIADQLAYRTQVRLRRAQARLGR
jgi:pilus assembly protein CpaE